MGSRRSSIMTGDDSTMYLSFDAEDKAQSAMVSQSSKMEAGDDRDLRRAVLKNLYQLSICHDPDQNSPLRPFDKSVMSTTPVLVS